MGSKSSTTPRKGYFLKCHISFLFLIFFIQISESLRTSSGSQGRSKSNVRINIGALIHPKERRLSFLNHQLSLLGVKVGPEPRITSTIYSHLIDTDAGTDEISKVEVPPNSDLIVGKEIPKGRRVVLECQAEFPVNWVYQGDGAPQMQTNTSIPVKRKGKYSAIAVLGSDEGVLDVKETGEYICRNMHNADESIRYYIYVPGKSYFIRRSGIIKLSPNDRTLRIPCSVANPEAKVTILKSNKGFLNCLVNETMSFSKKTGFTLNLIEDDENDVAGLYVCMAGINESYQLAEYSVIRSYENSTYEYNWDEQGMIFDDDYPADLGRNDDVCTPNPCGPNSVCSSKYNPRTGDPFTCSCQDGYRGKAPRCRSKSLCDPSPCGPNSRCVEDSERNYPKCTCLPNYIGRPPNCSPECVLDSDCHPSHNCVNNTCQNPCLSKCAIDAVCTVQKHVARCSCPIGAAGDPSTGGKCHRIRLPSVQFFPSIFGLRPRPVRRPPLRLQEEPQQIFPGDSLASTDFSDEYSGGEFRNPCEPWPCGPYSQCTPVGEFAHCKCNVGYVGLPPKCRAECMRDSDCSNSHTCIDNTCKNPCSVQRGKIRCGDNAQCRGKNHRAECTCPNGYRGDPLRGCYPASGEASGESQSQEPGMWGSSGPRPPPSSAGGSSNSMMESSEENQYTPKPSKEPSRPTTGRPQRPGQRPGGQRPKPNNPQHGQGGGGKPSRPPPTSDDNNNGGNEGSSCENFCGKNAICQQRNNTVTCRCKQGFTGPGSDPYTHCYPSRNPCQQCGPNSVCKVMGNGTPVCECQPGKLGSPPNCKDNVCRYNNDCPKDKMCDRQNCINPCARAKCGVHSTCRAINHVAVCACPDDPDVDPLEEEGCPPPSGSSGRPRLPGFFPPSRFFI